METKKTKLSIPSILSQNLFEIKTHLKPLVKMISNRTLRRIIINVNSKFSNYTFRKAILKYYSQIPDSEVPEDKKEVINFLKNNPLNLFPYEFIKKYKDSDIKVFMDADNGLRYTLLENKRLYFELNTMIPHEWAEQFAKEWISAWNAHDLERILSHFQEKDKKREENLQAIAQWALSREERETAAIGLRWPIGREVRSADCPSSSARIPRPGRGRIPTRGDEGQRRT